MTFKWSVVENFFWILTFWRKKTALFFWREREKKTSVILRSDKRKQQHFANPIRTKRESVSEWFYLWHSVWGWIGVLRTWTCLARINYTKWMERALKRGIRCKQEVHQINENIIFLACNCSSHEGGGGGGGGGRVCWYFSTTYWLFFVRSTFRIFLFCRVWDRVR